jgi:hypothetical protein
MFFLVNQSIYIFEWDVKSKQLIKWVLAVEYFINLKVYDCINIFIFFLLFLSVFLILFLLRIYSLNDDFQIVDRIYEYFLEAVKLLLILWFKFRFFSNAFRTFASINITWTIHCTISEQIIWVTYCSYCFFLKVPNDILLYKTLSNFRQLIITIIRFIFCSR